MSNLAQTPQLNIPDVIGSPILAKIEHINDLGKSKWNELVYFAKYSFEPIIGETYYLYYNKNGDIFLSLISPAEWNYEFIGAFKMDSTNKWNKV